MSLESVCSMDLGQSHCKISSWMTASSIWACMAWETVLNVSSHYRDGSVAVYHSWEVNSTYMSQINQLLLLQVFSRLKTEHFGLGLQLTAGIIIFLID